jgi:cysteine desulfurase/selenocysteine lyase
MVTKIFDLEKIRADFPILQRTIRDKQLVYLDNGATNLKPKYVVDVLSEHLLMGASNVHRGVHYLSEQATMNFESVREKVRKLINAKSTEEIIFTSGTTIAINIIAKSFGTFLKQGDEVIISHMEHHSNIVPWQMLREEKGIVLKVAPINDAGELDFEAFEKLITDRTKLVSMVWISNALGTINPVEKVIEVAHSRNIPVLLDGAQAVAHVQVDVQKLGVDFLVFSSHKMCGPTGVGVIYGKKELLNKMPPVIGGGDMIRSVTFEKTDYAGLPAKFEAGTPDIGGVIGFGAALDYLNSIGIENIRAWEKELLVYGTQKLAAIKGLRIIGTAKEKTSIISFVLDDIHPHDVGSILDQEGIAVRAGHHCTQPVMQRFGVPATTRASFSFYNSKREIDILAAGISKVQEIFA